MARGAWIAYARIVDIGARALGATREQLSSAERTRYARFATPRRRREFLAGRWLLAASRSAWNRSGGASISHSGGWVAVALVGRGVPGVDIEPMGIASPGRARRATRAARSMDAGRAMKRALRARKVLATANARGSSTAWRSRRGCHAKFP